MLEKEIEIGQSSTENIKKERLVFEKNRMIAHFGRVFSRRYDIAVIPSRQKGLWATSLDPKINNEVFRYIEGKRDTLDDLPPEAFQPKQILYDAESAQDMSWDEINTILHHEAGHAKYTDFRLMFEGQRKAKDEGYLPSSFWITFEGIEDPRINGLEGEESPAIDEMIRRNQANDLQKRITESPLTDRPYMLQFAYESFHRWLHGGGIPELAQTEVGRLGELAAPLLEQYFHNTDIEEKRGGRTHYRSDEAEMLYSYVHVLEGLKQGEFKTAWDYVINRDTTNGGDRFLQANTRLETDIRRLYDSIRVANRLREMYQAYQVGESNEPMDFTTSLREMVNIALRMNHAQNVKDVARRVILPKIGDRRQRVMVSQTIDAVLPQTTQSP